jgi:hypothetical protein
VLVIDTNGKPIDGSSARKKATVNFCTCGASVPGQDYNNTGQIKFRGGVNSSKGNLHMNIATLASEHLMHCTAPSQIEPVGAAATYIQQSSQIHT